MASYSPIIIKNGELRQIEAADSLQITRLGLGRVNISAGFPLMMEESSATTVFCQIQNTNSLGVCGYLCANDTGKTAEFGVRGSTRPNYGALLADNGYFYSGQTDLTFMVDFVGGIIKFAAGGNVEKVRISSAGLIIGSGTAIVKVLSATATLNFPSHGVVADLTMTVTGAAVGDPVFIGAPDGTMTALNSGVLYGWVSAADTVTIRQTTSGAGSTDAPSGTYRAVVFKF